MGHLSTSPHSVARREFLTSSMLLATSAAWLGGKETDATDLLGPILGHLETTEAFLWLKSAQPGTYEIRLKAEADGKTHALTLKAEETAHGCMTFHFKNLQPNSVYTYQAFENGTAKFPSEKLSFATPAPTAEKRRTKLVISSCAKEDLGSREVWQRMAACQPDGVVLLGDTPYIDSTEPEVLLKRHTASKLPPPPSKFSLAG